MSSSRRKRKTTINPKLVSEKRYRIWQMIVAISLFTLGVFLPFILPDNKFKIHAVINFVLFAFVVIIGHSKNQFRKKIANGFFESIKSFDIYAHIYGGIVVYLIFFTYLYGLDGIIIFNYQIIKEDLLIPVAILTIVLLLLYEVVEVFIEYSLSKLIRSDVKVKQNISESKKNVLQDIISDIIGVFLGLSYIYIVIIIG